MTVFHLSSNFLFWTFYLFSSHPPPPPYKQHHDEHPSRAFTFFFFDHIHSMWKIPGQDPDFLHHRGTSNIHIFLKENVVEVEFTGS